MCRIHCEVARKGSADSTEEVKGRLQGEGEEGSATLRMQPNVQVDWRQQNVVGKGREKSSRQRRKQDVAKRAERGQHSRLGSLFVMMGVESVENTGDQFGGAGRRWIRHVKVLYLFVRQWGAVRAL